MNNVLESLYCAIEIHSDRVAVNDGLAVWTYAKLDSEIGNAKDNINKVSQGRRLRIGIYLPNSTQYVSGYYGTMAAGCLPFLVDISANTAELSAVFNSCGITHFVIAQKALATFPISNIQQVAVVGAETILVEIKDVPAATPEALPDTVTCRFTSGSSGVPKCLEFSGDAVTSAAINWVEGTALQADDKILCMAGMPNGLAFNTSLLATFIAGATLHFYTGILMAGRILDALHQRGITRLIGFPVIYQQMVALQNIPDTQKTGLNLAISASASLDKDIRKEFLRRFQVDISDYYGIAETGPVTFETDADFNEGQGAPLPGADVQIESDHPGGTGPILVKTASFASGYLNHTGAFSKKLNGDGYFVSDDLGTLKDGRLFLRGKTSKFANIGGRNVFAAEISSFIKAMDDVADAEVFIDKDKSDQDLLHAVVVAGKSVTREVIVASCRTNLARHKIPSRITFIDKIPRSGVGKISLTTLLEAVQEAT